MTLALTSSNQLITIPTIAGLSVRWPVDGTVYPLGDWRRPAVTGPFAYIRVAGSTFRHFGIDIGVWTGVPIKPLDEGTASSVQTFDAGDYGIHVFVRHSWGYSLYAHLSVAYVREGDPVTRDTALGESGNTGFSFAPHLHTEARLPDFGTRFNWQEYVGVVVEPPQEDDLDDEQKALLAWLKDAKPFLQPDIIAARETGVSASLDTPATDDPVSKYIRRRKRFNLGLTGPVSVGQPPGTMAALAWDLSQPEGDS